MPTAASTIKLVPMRPEHADVVVGWRNDSANAQWFKSKGRFSVDGHLGWLAGLPAGTDFNWVIETDAGEIVGAVGLYNIDWAERTAEFGRLLIGESAQRGRGYAKQALVAVLDLARQLGLRSVYLEVYKDNVSAIALYERTGFAGRKDAGEMAHYSVTL